MTKLVNWGRWVVAAYFGMIVVGSIAGLFAVIISHVRENQSFYPVYMGFFLLVPAVACAWGLVKWRHWAYVLALVLTSFAIFTVPLTYKVSGLHASDWELLILNCATLVWLLLPAVRARYSRRNQFA